MPCDASVVLTSLQAKALETNDRGMLGQTLVEKLAEALPHASWVGIYWLDGETLRLGPYTGAETDHVAIPVGRGVCGTAVEEGRDQIVPDVRDVEAYLACSPTVRSEMVILIRSMGKVVGCIDLDGEALGAFGAVDQCILRAVADSFGGLLAGSEDPPADEA